MAETTVLVLQIAVSLVIPFLIALVRQKRLNGHAAIVDVDADCASIRLEYAGVERRISQLMGGAKMGMDDLRVLCYNVLETSLDEICASGVKRDCAVSLLLTARKRSKLLDLWKSIARTRPDLINDL